MKRGIVIALEWVCGVLDNIPTWAHDTEGRRVRCYGRFGCGPPMRLAQRAADLDARWHTGVWGESP